jgi:hypothetical protein
MKHRVHIAQKHATAKCAPALTQLHSGHECLFRTGDTASNQNQESARMDRSAPQQRDWRALDHEVTCQDSGGDSLETQRRSRLKATGPVSPSPVGLAIVKLQ